ncbi:ATP-binding protein [Streptodolium elevatio]|uniref:ATP-binding protein n=1 Tax=Streptodolium elevatio TaxID=3157996 RepID=A0ABV3DJN9_9ACTN
MPDDIEDEPPMEPGPPVLTLDLDETAGAVRRARDLTAQVLTDPDPAVAEETVRDVVMVVAELVSNAHRHAPGPYRLTVSVATDAVKVSMRDGGRTWLSAVPDERPPGGFGLLVVRRLSRTLDLRTVPDGKVITAVVTRRP